MEDLECNISTNDEPMLPCDPPCPKRCTLKANLERHKKSMRCYHNLPFVCDACNKRFHSETALIGHAKKGRCVKGDTRISYLHMKGTTIY